jgi:O-antigen/teichoic acid export membrane protein
VTRNLARRAGSAVVWHSAALAGEKLIFLVRLVVLARLLLPEDFGLVAVGMAAMALMVSVTDLGVVAALVQQPSNEKPHLDTAWTISVLRGALVSLVLVLAAPQIAAAFGEPTARPFVQAIAFTVFLRSAASIRIAHLNRELHFRSLAIIGLATAVVNTVVAIVLAPSQGAWALVWGSIAGALTFLLASFMAAPYMPRFRFSRMSVGSIMRFGRWIFLIGIIAVLGDTILRMIISRQLGVAELGVFFMAARLGFLPAQLITEIVGTVAFPVYAHLQKDRRKATSMYRQVLVITTALMVPVCSVFICLVPDLVVDVLGERWNETVVIMQILILSSMIGTVGSSVGPLLKGVGQPQKIAWMELWKLIILIVPAWFLVARYGLAGAGIAWLFSIAATQAIALYYAVRLLDMPFEGLGRVLFAIGLCALLASVVAAVAVREIDGLVGILAAAAGAALATISLMFVLDERLRLGLRATLSEPFPWIRRLEQFFRR